MSSSRKVSLLVEEIRRELRVRDRRAKEAATLKRLGIPALLPSDPEAYPKPRSKYVPHVGKKQQERRAGS